MDFLKSPKVIIGGLIALVVVIGLVSLVGTYTSVRNEGRRQELALTKQFKDTQVQYGQFRTSIYDQLSIAREKRDAMDKILVDAVTGRYDKKGANNEVDRTAVFSAIKEAYPNLDGLDIYDKIIVQVQAGREAFAKNQEQLQDEIRSYDQWRTTGSLLHPWFVEKLGFPSPLLEARVGDKVYRGVDAYDKMSRIIVGSDTSQIFDSGVDKPLGK
jgi:hypothetical protein